MRVVCAWCQKEGRPALIREDGSGDAPFDSHGICDDHSIRLLREIRGRLKQAWHVSPPEGFAAATAGGSAEG